MLDADEGYYPVEDIDEEPEFGLCSQCGENKYLFQSVELTVNSDGSFQCYDICADCLCEVVREFVVNGEEVSN
jgi:hypothetical protein